MEQWNRMTKKSRELPFALTLNQSFQSVVCLFSNSNEMYLGGGGQVKYNYPNIQAFSLCFLFCCCLIWSIYHNYISTPLSPTINLRTIVPVHKVEESKNITCLFLSDKFIFRSVPHDPFFLFTYCVHYLHIWCTRYFATIYLLHVHLS